MRHVPIVFVGGEPEKVARARETLPDATFAEWLRIRSAVRAAARSSNDSPVVPPTPGFDSKTPLRKKLGIEPDYIVALLRAPEGFDETLGKLPTGVRVRRRTGAAADLVLLFVRSSIGRRSGRRYRSCRE
jgi:hypothetical protein